MVLIVSMYYLYMDYDNELMDVLVERKKRQRDSSIDTAQTGYRARRLMRLSLSVVPKLFPGRITATASQKNNYSYNKTGPERLGWKTFARCGQHFCWALYIYHRAGHRSGKPALTIWQYGRAKSFAFAAQMFAE